MISKELWLHKRLITFWLDYKVSWAPENQCFWTVVLEKSLESPLDCKEIQPVHPKENESWIFIGRTDVEAETPILWPPDVKSRLIWKDPDAGKDQRQEEKGTTEDEMVGWHPLLQPSIFPSIRIFSSESFLRIRWPKYWSFSFSNSPSNEYSRLISFKIDWLDLLTVQGTLKSHLQHHSSKASILWHSAYFIVQPKCN